MPAPVVFGENLIVADRKVIYREPRVLGYFPPAAGLERRGLVHPGQYVELGPLLCLLRCHLNAPLLLEQLRRVKVRLLQHLPGRAVDVLLPLVALPLGEPPRGVRLHALHKQAVLELGV